MHYLAYLLAAVASKLGRAYQGPNPAVSCGQRACLHQQGLVAGTAVGILIALEEANAVISSKYCASGQGKLKLTRFSTRDTFFYISSVIL